VSRQQNWRAAAAAVEIAQVGRRIAPRVALIGFVCAGIAAVPTIIRHASVFG
jgi:hypothetical protein